MIGTIARYHRERAAYFALVARKPDGDCRSLRRQYDALIAYVRELEAHVDTLVQLLYECGQATS
jgi:hypothetical protein